MQKKFQKIVLPDLNINKIKNYEGVYLIKNFITNKNIFIGDYTYYHCSSVNEAESFQNKNILYHYPFIDDKIIIGKFCSIAYQAKFLMNGANHNYQLLTTYPLNFLTNDKKIASISLINKGDIIIGHDVWIGYDAIILPGVNIGNGAVIGAKTVVTKDVPAYAIVVGNPGKIIKYRFNRKTIKKLEELKWYEWNEKKFNEHYLDFITKLNDG